ncbi:FERRY endosomal RAB5 effector complex subunit 3 isoform X6 [Hydra vulgaris]|uniref:FERRY endosomal RAB5 effector complex subunit 3 isoform X6 n=1 Tax=Hydra vulgaris TaxID=6087 RepID=A0ABM4BDN0_HYDVU
MDNELNSPSELGESISYPSTEEKFIFFYNFNGYQNKLMVNVKIPLKSVYEFGYRIIESHSIPCYLEEELIQSLDLFVQQKTKDLWDSTFSKMISNVQNSEEHYKLIQDWVKVFLKVNETNECDDLQSSWASVYHSLIHSPALEQLLQLEHNFALAIKELNKQKDCQIEDLNERHVAEMEQMISNVGNTRNDSDVNDLAAKQLDESQILETFWSNALLELKGTQKHEYKHWVQTVHDNIVNDRPLSRTRRISSESLNNFELPNQSEVHMEESFTIYLGNQIKSMHNIRLVCRDVMDYCQCKTSFIGDSMVLQPQRLQTAMTLYSESLSGLILLVDDRLTARTGIKKSDFYITKHSNLAEVHAVFHLVCDDSVISGSLNSRHPIMIGLRNILLVAARHSINNLIVPLLLVHEMGENFTVQWCMKRAELIFKCVKGFMMEGLSWDGQDSKTVQFVVPPGISEELFLAFSNMLPNIFRVSTTLNLSNI